MTKSDFWVTPQKIYDLIPAWNFDPCPINPTFDGLKIKWHGWVYCNPPYSEIEKWILKAVAETKNCESIFMLLPQWTDRSWFNYLKSYEILFIQKRIKFLEPKTMRPGKFSPRFGSMIIKIK